jgi:microcystin-dependent protein
MAYLGEIRMFAGTFAPAGWAFCDGSLLPISENDALFTLIGTTYGGDGQETFALPDLRGRVPIHQGSSFQIGQNGGAEEVTLTTQQVATHNHALLATRSTATATAPGGQVPAPPPDVNVTPYGSDNPPTTLSVQSVGGLGGSQPHTNFQPYLCVNFILSLFGDFPTQT